MKELNAIEDLQLQRSTEEQEKAYQKILKYHRRNDYGLELEKCVHLARIYLGDKDIKQSRKLLDFAYHNCFRNRVVPSIESLGLKFRSYKAQKIYDKILHYKKCGMIGLEFKEYRHLTCVLIKEGDPEQAGKMVLFIWQLSPMNLFIIKEMGELYQAMGEDEIAENIIRKIDALDPLRKPMHTVFKDLLHRSSPSGIVRSVKRLIDIFGFKIITSYAGVTLVGTQKFCKKTILALDLIFKTDRRYFKNIQLYSGCITHYRLPRAWAGFLYRNRNIVVHNSVLSHSLKAYASYLVHEGVHAEDFNRGVLGVETKERSEKRAYGAQMQFLRKVRGSLTLRQRVKERSKNPFPEPLILPG